ncbi:uncharacterized protein G2W53_022297 [Senna tora]|uniref:Uncharacterized protein n=1 Tax=Senna tora TaxID=362788 RepID=A0A834TKZ8_9FABA|nr:uncharacterized protein G2W53_022297 [Senna tora]
MIIRLEKSQAQRSLNNGFDSIDCGNSDFGSCYEDNAHTQIEYHDIGDATCVCVFCGAKLWKSAQLLKEKEKGGTKLVNLEEDEASSHTEKETLVSEETVPREKFEPLSLSVETISQKTGTKAAASPPASPTVAELLKEPKNEQCVFRMLQETLRSSTFNLDSLERTNTVLKQILDSIQTTNALLTSIQSLLQKQTSKPSVPETILPLRITPQIEDVD